MNFYGIQVESYGSYIAFYIFSLLCCYILPTKWPTISPPMDANINLHDIKLNDNKQMNISANLGVQSHSNMMVDEPIFKL